MALNYCTQFPQNWHSTQIMDVSRWTWIQYVYCVP